MVNNASRENEALLKHGFLAPVLYEKLPRRQLRARLRELAGQTFYDERGTARTYSWRTLEEWYYQIKKGGFDDLKRKPRKDAGACRALDPALVELVIALKQEDPGRSAPLILQQLELAGRIREGDASVSTIQRLLRRRGLAGPQLELARKDRRRFRAAHVNELWQGDALHGPKLINPRNGQPQTVKVFALIDDHSRRIVNIQAGFPETEAAFLAVLHGALARCGIPRTLYLDNGSSFVGRDLRLACARAGVRLIHSCPYEASSRGKIERFFRTLREQVIDRLDLASVKTVDDLNVRLASWVEGEYNARPHASLDGRTPREVWDEGEADVRWVEDHGRLAEIFRGTVTRHARNDATVTLDGKTYEVPGHLRRRAVTLSYSLLEPDRVWVIDGSTQVPVKAVDAIANARRRRQSRPAVAAATPRPTGLNPVEQILARVTGRPTSGSGGDRA